MLKHIKTKKYKLLDGHTYLMDKIKMILNRKGEVVLSSTSSTVIREEREDTFSLNSLEMSQREEEH